MPNNSSDDPIRLQHNDCDRHLSPTHPTTRTTPITPHPNALLTLAHDPADAGTKSAVNRNGGLLVASPGQASALSDPDDDVLIQGK